VNEKERNDRSLFFPLALIAAGVIWILVSMGRIPAENLWALVNFWPFLLIAAGLGLILRSFWRGSQLLVDVLIVGGAVLAIVFAPQLGWTKPQWNLGDGMNFAGSVSGSGKVTTTTRELRPFSKIDISYPAEVVIQQGKSELVKIEAEDNLIPQLSTEVKDGTLYINNKVSSWSERVRPTKPVRLTITVKDLQSLDFSSAGGIRIEKLRTDSLKVRLSGAGQLVIDQLQAKTLDCALSGAGGLSASGTIDDLQLRLSGVGSFDGISLTALKANVRLSGVGSATLNVTDDLTAQVSGVGSVRYVGSPQLHEQVSGLGSVNKIEK
jgi:hypothetical protein